MNDNNFNQWYRIGEICKMFDINIQTLRYYESIGLFIPRKRDPSSDHRYYHFSQTFQLASILYLRKLGYSIQEIREYTENRNCDFVINRLKIQSQKITKKWKSLVQINEAIDRKISFVEEQTRDLNPDFIGIKSLPARYYKLIGAESAMYKSPDFYIYPTLTFYDQNHERSFGVLLGEGQQKIKDSREIAPDNFLCGYHKGFYDTMEQTFKRLRRYGAKQGLRLERSTVNTNIIDQFIEARSEHYITEVHIRIRGNL